MTLWTIIRVRHTIILYDVAIQSLHSEDFLLNNNNKPNFKAVKQ